MMGGKQENILRECEQFVIRLIEKFDKQVKISRM